MPYCEDADVDKVFGASNVTVWADVDNDQDADKMTARKLWARTVASDEVDDILTRPGTYMAPLKNQAGTVPNSIIHIAAVLSGGWLYEWMGIQDVDSAGNPIHRLTPLLKWARDKLERIRDGTEKIDAVH